MKPFFNPRAGLPEKARVTTVVSSLAARMARLWASGAPDSGQGRKAVPSCAADAPACIADTISWPSIKPPVAITGMLTAAAVARTRSSVGTIDDSNESKNVPRCAPASKPCATTASTPACSNWRASSTVVAVPTMAMPRALRRAIASRSGMPKVKLKIGGRASSTASSCAGNGSGAGVGATGGGSPSFL